MKALLPSSSLCAADGSDTRKAMYTTPADAPLTYTFNEVQKYAAELDAHVHHDWHVPTKGELNVLRENRNEGALKGTFNVTGSGPVGWYWSSSQNNNNAWDQRFSDGNQGGYDEVMQEPADVFEIVRTVGLALPDVEATTKYDGSPVLKLGGCFMAGLATHRSAERLWSGSALKIANCLSRMRPRPNYLTDYYRGYPLMLVRRRGSIGTPCATAIRVMGPDVCEGTKSRSIPPPG